MDKVKELFKAVKHGDYKTVEDLAEQKVNINVLDREGYLPIVYAAMLNDVRMFKILIRSGADLEAKISDGIFSAREFIVHAIKNKVVKAGYIVDYLKKTEKVVEGTQTGIVVAPSDHRDNTVIAETGITNEAPETNETGITNNDPVSEKEETSESSVSKEVIENGLDVEVVEEEIVSEENENGIIKGEEIVSKGITTEEITNKAPEASDDTQATAEDSDQQTQGVFSEQTKQDSDEQKDENADDEYGINEFINNLIR